MGGCRFRARGHDVDRCTSVVCRRVADSRGLPLRRLLLRVPGRVTVAMGEIIYEVKDAVRRS